MQHQSESCELAHKKKSRRLINMQLILDMIKSNDCSHGVKQQLFNQIVTVIIFQLS